MNTISIGDIHGRYHTFLKLLDILEKDYSLNESNLVLHGDYIDRGPYSKQVIDKVMELQQTFPNKIVTLKGNHEDMCVSFHRYKTMEDPIHAEEMGSMFLYNGGMTTVSSFYENIINIDAFKDHRIPDKYLDWMQALTLKHEDEHAYYVHAGLTPYRSFDDQIDEELMWIRANFLHHDYKWDKVVVHGHTKSDFFSDERRICVDQGAGYGKKLTALIMPSREHITIDVVKEDIYR